MELTEQEKAQLEKKKKQEQKQAEKKKEPKEEQESGDDEEDQTKQQGVDGEKKKKKKKKNRKKKKKNGEEKKQESLPVIEDIPLQQLQAETQTNERFRCLGGWTQPVKLKFPNNQFQAYGPCQLMEYNVPRVKTEQTKVKDATPEQHLQYLRKGAEIHKQVRRFAQKIIKPGRRMIDICQELENYNRKLAPENGLQSGIGFPTGCSLNHCAAHWTPNPGDTTVLGYDDVCKIDFGTHIKGRIIDCAFTVAFNPTYDKLLEAVKDATYTGIQNAGIDVRLGQLGGIIQQTMESYEVEIKGKVYPVKVIKNLNGHSIGLYKIHAGKTVPCVKSNSNQVMEEGQCYAIETFGSTGKGYCREENSQISHYMQDFNLPPNVKIPGRSKEFYNTINQKFGTLAFCKRWIEKMDIPSYILPLRDLCQNGIINPYPALYDTEGSYVAQWEHTFLLRSTCKEILSRGEDF